MCKSILRVAAVVCLTVLASFAATLEKLTTEEMSQKATLIVRGRVTGCSGDVRGAIIYTACTVAVTERWKGQAGTRVQVWIPGGTARGLVQTFTGTPKFTDGDEYVLFLWAGRSGLNQVIGLSQGVFDLKPTGISGTVKAKRSASTERMVNKAGEEIADQSIELRVSELKAQVQRALGMGAQQ
jgi:hypothetical protein